MGAELNAREVGGGGRLVPQWEILCLARRGAHAQSPASSSSFSGGWGKENESPGETPG